ncbi:hypothetical protein OEZ85_012791 [Tetradesmus obliquus]|uniref:Uncharacterized protein n=1 Tax=Tetradesmus obliquus TaxID=3088 RepID=A0ABY8U7T7_TETOB|nr:hypothetical protein OEZ85_012791 [Tetradesmus obliquus]
MLPEPSLEDHIRCVRLMGLRAEGFEREARHQQEQRADQLKKLMQKDALIKLALSGYMMGRCTYSQLAKLYVLMYPWQPATPAFGRAVQAVLKEGQAALSTRRI